MDFKRARELTQALKADGGAQCTIAWCEDCDSYHVTALAGTVGSLDADTVSILDMFAQGLRTQEIAQTMGISRRRVERVYNRLMEQFGAISRTQLVVYAALLGIIDPLRFFPNVTEEHHGHDRPADVQRRIDRGKVARSRVQGAGTARRRAG